MKLKLTDDFFCKIGVKLMFDTINFFINLTGDATSKIYTINCIYSLIKFIDNSDPNNKFYYLIS